MKRAEKMIRKQIEALTLERIGPKRFKIENGIEYLYWQGALSEKKSKILNKVLTNKYTEIMDNYNSRIAIEWNNHLDAIINGNVR